MNVVGGKIKIIFLLCLLKIGGEIFLRNILKRIYIYYELEQWNQK